MTTDEILRKFPSSIILALTNPHTRQVHFVREDEYGQHRIDPPLNYRTAFDLFGYKPIVRRPMGRADVATTGDSA